MLTHHRSRRLVFAFCSAVLSVRLFGQTEPLLAPELKQLVTEIAVTPRSDDPVAEHSLWERKMAVLGQGSRLGTNLWPAIPSLVTFSGHTNSQVSVFSAALLARAKAQEHPQWNQIQAQLRSTPNAYRAFEWLMQGPEKYTRLYDPNHRRFAITVLGIIGPPARSTAPGLIRILESKADIDIPLWGHVAASLHGMEIDGDIYLPLLRKRFADTEEDLALRVAAADALASAKAADPETIALLRKSLEDRYSQVRLAAAHALLLIDLPLTEVQPTLTALLQHQLASIRAGVLRALAEIGPRALPMRAEIIVRIDDPASTVREAAQEALGRLSPSSTGQPSRAEE